MNAIISKPQSESFIQLIDKIRSGELKLPKFQRKFVWSTQKTADLLDSILKGFPIGTFIIWETNEKFNEHRNIGEVDLPNTPSNKDTLYVLDGQQRITSLFAACNGALVEQPNKKTGLTYKNIVVNLNVRGNNSNEKIVTYKPIYDRYIPLTEVINFGIDQTIELINRFSKDELKLINHYHQSFTTYNFSTVFLQNADIDSAVEVFTRLNTGGQSLKVFDIMVAKTYDEHQNFDMQEKWQKLLTKLEKVNYGEIKNSIILGLLVFMCDNNKSCVRSNILRLDKQFIIDNWDKAESAIIASVEHFRTEYRIPNSALLPSDSLLVPFSYFFYRKRILNEGKPEHLKNTPTSIESRLLREFFWRNSLSQRYSAAQETRVSKDIGRIEKILKEQRPTYEETPNSYLHPERLIETPFKSSDGFSKAFLCLLSYYQPKDFDTNGVVHLNDLTLLKKNKMNVHHFFPKAFLKKKGIGNENSLMNVTLISDNLNKNKIKTKSPKEYIERFSESNSDIERSLKSHLIELNGFGIQSNNYSLFLKKRAELVLGKLKERIS